jgi:hypothetical protein
MICLRCDMMKGSGKTTNPPLVSRARRLSLAVADARRKLVHETAFTWLNRLVAFRLMEERKLLKQTIVRLGQSNGCIFWLTLDDANKEAYALHQRGGLPLNAMGEGPSDIAYRCFLLWQFTPLLLL